MNEFKELELLKETLKNSLMSDELEQTLFYLDDWKRLKELEFKIKSTIKKEIKEAQEQFADWGYTEKDVMKSDDEFSNASFDVGWIKALELLEREVEK